MPQAYCCPGGCDCSCCYGYPDRDCHCFTYPRNCGGGPFEHGETQKPPEAVAEAIFDADPKDQGVEAQTGQGNDNSNRTDRRRYDPVRVAAARAAVAASRNTGREVSDEIKEIARG